MMSRDQPGSVRLRFTNVDTKWHTGTYKHFLTLILVNYVCGIFAFKPLGLTPPHPPNPKHVTHTRKLLRQRGSGVWQLAGGINDVLSFFATLSKNMQINLGFQQFRLSLFVQLFECGDNEVMYKRSNLVDYVERLQPKSKKHSEWSYRYYFV